MGFHINIDNVAHRAPRTLVEFSMTLVLELVYWSKICKLRNRSKNISILKIRNLKIT